LETDKAPTDEELVRWSAEVLMEWTILDEYPYNGLRPGEVCYWKGTLSGKTRIRLAHPSHLLYWNPISKDNGQIWDVMERMEEMEWEYRSQSICKAHYFRFFKKQDNKSDKYGEAYATTPVRAILLAAWRAVGENR
jgi:hypothetical protein